MIVVQIVVTVGNQKFQYAFHYDCKMSKYPLLI